MKLPSVLAASAVLGSVLLGLSMTSLAEDEIDSSIIEFSAGTGYMAFDSERSMTDEPFGGFSMGVAFSRHWSFLLQYTRLNNEFQGEQTYDVKVQKYHVDTIYHFNTENNWRPYVVAGIGEIEFKRSIAEDDDEYQANLGLGLAYRFTPNWFLRCDARNFFSLGQTRNDQTYMASLVYRVGSGER